MLSRLLSFLAVSLTALALLVLAGCAGKTSSGKLATATPLQRPPASIKPASTPIVTGSVAAIVNGHAVPLSEFRTYLNLFVRTAPAPGTGLRKSAEEAMKQVVDYALIHQFAEAHHISVGPRELDRQQTKDEALVGGKVPFVRRLKQDGLTLTSYRTLVAPNLLAVKVERYLYPVHPTRQPYAHVERILISLKLVGKPSRTDAQAKALGDKLLAQVRHGASFGGLARQYSDDPRSAAQGGDLGKVPPHQLPPPLDHAAFTLPLHDPTIVHSQEGYDIIEVLGRGTSSPVLSQADQQAQRTKFLGWLTRQERQAKIQRVAKVKASP